ncbi:NAD(P)/FAD-dependent oxidoreductase [Enterococcus sp. AZ109]|uniref:NAD(P)/FAD-dependent oxidoreductase n=1 Tax=Enterococcus sp. AZ109 TaxID=2774634 RepID=UPI003F1F5B2E
MNLFKKGQIGKMKLKNRVIMAPMGTKPESDGSYTPNAINYFEERAKGGVGLIITGANIATTKYEERPENELSNFHNVEKLAVLVERCHHHGAKVCVQITPGLGRMVYADPFNPPYSASDEAYSFWFPELRCRQLTVDDIHYLVDKIGYSASLAKAAGADSVELHGYGGYLMDQFHSSMWNKRTDEYGGSLENRLRFSTEAIASIKKYCGEDFPVLMKFTAYHGIEGGRELDEGIEMAKIFEAAGVSALHVDVGCYEVWYKAITTVYEEPMHQIFATKAIKAAVNIPVIGQGKLNDPKDAEAVLENGYADFIGLAHQMLADPYWLQKVKQGHIDQINPCIGCNECLLGGFSGKHYYCAVNPLCYAEKDYQLTPATEKKRVLVVGGGPGGMEAAIAAAERGFDVQLWEKDMRLGGNLHAAGYPTFKKDVLKLVAYMERRILRLNVDVHYGKAATAEEILAGDFDKVIIATGSKSKMPPIPGIEYAATANDYLTGKKTPKDKVVIIGGGLVGCETALYMTELAEEVTVVEMLDDILKTVVHSKNNDLSLRHRIAATDIQLLTSVAVKEITQEAVIIKKDEQEVSVPADTVIIAAGYDPINELEEALEDHLDVTVVGDAVASRKIMDAVHEAYHAIRVM